MFTKPRVFKTTKSVTCGIRSSRVLTAISHRNIMNSIIFITLLGFACFSCMHTVEAKVYDSRMPQNVFTLSDDIQDQINNLTLAIETMNRNLKGLEEKLYPSVEKQQDYESSGITYSDGKYTYHNIRISHFADEPKFCIRNTDGVLECSSLPLPSNCADSNLINCWNNKCRIRNRVYGRESFVVACEDITEFGDGWTVIQRRVNNSVDFNRNWSEYQKGFGDLDGNYWIGLDKLHGLANKLNPVSLYIRLRDFNNIETYQTCTFSIGDENSNYAVNEYGTCSGTMRHFKFFSKDCEFSSKDHENNTMISTRNGGWWRCKESDSNNNLNGEYYGIGEGSVKQITTGGIYLEDYFGFKFAYKYVEMMIKKQGP